MSQANANNHPRVRGFNRRLTTKIFRWVERQTPKSSPSSEKWKGCREKGVPKWDWRKGGGFGRLVEDGDRAAGLYSS